MKKQSNFRPRRRIVRRLQDLFSGTRGAGRCARRHSATRLESLEGRLMLAGDLGLDLPLWGDSADVQVGDVGGGEISVATAAAMTESPAEGENTPQMDLVAFAKALNAKDGVKLYGTAWCPACTQQKQLFQDGADFLPFIEVTNPDRSPNSIAIAEGITSYPTWKFPDGTTAGLLTSLATISARAGVPIPTSVDPFVAPIADLTVANNSPLYIGSPRHIGLDGYDPNGGPLTFTVASSDPSIVQATLLSGNRSARVSVAGWGDMVFELFEARVPRATNRFITLAQSGSYNSVNNNPDVDLHRVIDNFMLQFGILHPTSGASSPEAFDDEFHPDLQHNTKGALSWAKTSEDDSGTTQVFVTDGPTRHLDFNHSYFGQLTEGDKVRDAITMTATDDDDRPEVPIYISSVSIFEDTENAVVMLKAVEGATGSADIVVTVTDEDGNTYVETFQATVAADPFNGGPFLEDIPIIQTTVNTPATFPLSAMDVEGDAVFYGGVKTGTVNYTVSVDSQTGQAVVTPPTGYIGTMEVLVYARPVDTDESDTTDIFDTQRVSIVVTPDAPLSLDLLPASDSGSSDSDNVTNMTGLQFEVTGVTDGALVRLQHEDTVLGQATASGTSVTMTTSGLAALGDGTYSLFATQTIDNIESPASSALDVTVDMTAPPAFTSTPPTTVTVNTLLSYDAENSEEGISGTTYSLIGAPVGVTMNAINGLLSWTPGTNQVGTHLFTVAITDAAGNSRSQDLDVQVLTDALVGFRVELVDLSGVPISAIDVGGEFELRVHVTDIAADPRGVYAAYLDVLYDQQLVAANGALGWGPSYFNGKSGSLAAPGIIDEAGGFAGASELGGSEYLLVRLPMKAISAGDAVFQADPADDLSFHELLRFGEDYEVDFDEVVYGSMVLTINPAFVANDDVAIVNEDITNVPLDPLANDEVLAGSPGELTIVDVGVPDQGGSIEIAADGKSLIYTPLADFFGSETFTYTASDTAGTRTASFAVQVRPQNDNPTAVDDELVVAEDTVDFELDVLANDLFAPDTGETLTITSFDGLSAGGSLTITPEKDRLLYTPAENFFGTETFTYTISDGNGGTDEATVTVEVVEANDPPVATNDVSVVMEDSEDNPLNVLANDNTAGDPEESLSIVGVTTPEEGGTVAIAADKLSLLYSPEANFFGTDRFTYTITDGSGGFAEATVVVTVTGTNDPPTANSDFVTVVKGSSNNEVDVLANDSSAPDADEALKVTGATAAASGASVSVAADGLRIFYTPPADYTGQDTITYTIEDPLGAPAEATVTVEVLEYIPSKIAGYVYLDVNNSGVKDAGETPLGGVEVRLVGTDMFDQSVELQQITDARGFYQFGNLAPGSYEVIETHPQLLIDGIDRAGDVVFAAGTDSLPLELEQDSDVTGFNFGERGRVATHITLFSFFASTPRESVMISTNVNGDAQWYAVEGGWSHAQSMNAVLEPAMTSAQLNVTSMESQDYSTTLDFAVPRHVQVLGAVGDTHLLRVVGSPQTLFPGADCPCATGAEGEASSVLIAAADAEGELQLPLMTPAVAVPTGISEAVAQLELGPVPLTSISPLDQSFADDGEGESPSLRATPADGYLATDILMVELTQPLLAQDAAERLFESEAVDDGDFLGSVDQIMAQLVSGEAFRV